MLKYPIYVRNVTNLSDARYCAGMAVEKIGFCLDPNMKSHLDFNQFEGIKGWLSGIEIVEEYINFPENISDCENISIIWNGKNIIPTEIKSQVIYSIDLDASLSELPEKGSFLVVNAKLSVENYEILLKNLCNNYQVYIGFGISAQNIDAVLNEYKPYGFSLVGEDEIAPGLKNFDALAEILESIEID